MTKISIIIPTYNEENNIISCLERLQFLRKDGHEVIIVDSGSQDHTLELVDGFADKIIVHQKGRATQMNVGAGVAFGDVLLFLHADTLLNKYAIQQMITVIDGEDEIWGRFDLSLSGCQWPLRIIEKFMNIRTRFTGIVTGDHCIFISRHLFTKIGGFKNIEIMEDIEISKRLNKQISPICIKSKIITSSRRWEENGIIKTVIKMWYLRILYYFGVTPDKLNQLYEYKTK